MAITISIEELNIKAIDRQRYSREDDIKSITEIARDMRGKERTKFSNLQDRFAVSPSVTTGQDTTKPMWRA